MIGRATRRFYGTSAEGLRFGAPIVWARSIGLKAGDPCDVFFDEVLVVVPEQARGSRQAQAVLRAMREARR